MISSPFEQQVRYDWLSQFEHLYVQWHTDSEKTEPIFRIENIHFEHDPQWNSRFLGIQSARDRNHWVWKATRMAFLAAGAL